MNLRLLFFVCLYLISISVVAKDSLIRCLCTHVTRSVFIQWPLAATHLQLQRCSHSHWPAGLQPRLQSPCSHTGCVQNKLSEQRFHSAKCISEDLSLRELFDASAFRRELHTGNINPAHLIQGHIFKLNESVLTSADNQFPWQGRWGMQWMKVTF